MHQQKRYLSDADIARIRSKWRVERTIDECLTRKLERRRGPDYASPQLAELSERLELWLRHECGTGIRVTSLKRMPGGGSKEMFTFSLVDGAHETPLVLRMDPGASVVETHRAREFQIMKAMEGTVPVPKMYWVDGDGSHLGNASLVCGFVTGVAKPSQRVGEGGAVSGLGVGFPAHLRGPLFEDFLKHLIAIHSFDWRSAQLDAFDVPTPGTTESVDWNLASWRRIWEEDSPEEHPVLTLAAQWLAKHHPVSNDIRVVHNDYRNGNFLFDEESRAITAVLDWEMTHLADVHEDLAWILFPGFAAAGEDGVRRVCGLATREEFLQRYEQASGITPDPQRLAYYEILNIFKLAVLSAATNVRAAADRQTHLDIMMNFSTGMGYLSMSLLMAKLREQGVM